MDDVRHLVWDPGNIAHIARHGVTVHEVEEACRAEHITLMSYLGREIVIGTTGNGRLLTTVLEPIPGRHTWYVVTARSASRRERRYYQERMEEGSS
jgi:uncharacterized DUF497 family protein